MFTKKKQRLLENRYWKERNQIYLRELQNFFDKADNISDIKLKKNIIEQMLRCDNALTEIAEKQFEVFYKNGYQKGKNE